MGIGIETNLALICSAINVNYVKMINEYSGMTIEQIVTKERSEGNTLADNFTLDILNNPEKLVEFIKLYNPDNKFAILSHMNENDLMDMLPLLEDEDLIMGLNFFTQEQLFNFVAELPPDQAANLALQMFSPEHLMCLMPNEALDDVIGKRELKQMRGLELACVATLPPEIKAQMIEAVTGEIPGGVKGVNLAGEYEFDDEMLMKQITEFDKDVFQESLHAIPHGHKQLFMLGMVTEEPGIWGLFDSQYFSDIIAARKKKDDIIESAFVIEKPQLVQMNALLPKELMSVVLTQIKSGLFAEVLQQNFRDVLGQLVVS